MIVYGSQFSGQFMNKQNYFSFFTTDEITPTAEVIEEDPFDTSAIIIPTAGTKNYVATSSLFKILEIG